LITASGQITPIIPNRDNNAPEIPIMFDLTVIGLINTSQIYVRNYFPGLARTQI